MFSRVQQMLLQPFFYFVLLGVIVIWEKFVVEVVHITMEN